MRRQRQGVLVAVAICVLGGCNDSTVAVGNDNPLGTVGGLVLDAFSFTPPGSSSVLNGGALSAGFQTLTYKPSLVCKRSTVGACKILDCKGDLAGGVASRDDSVGNIQVTIGPRSYTLASNAQNSYSVQPPTSFFSRRPWNPGDSIVVTPPGLSAISLIGPAEPTVITPTLPAAGTSLTIPSSVDFAVALSGGTGVVRLSMTINQSPTHGTSITCDSMVSSGGITVPKATLQMVGAGAGSLSLNAIDFVDAKVGAYDTVIQASTAVLVSSGDELTGIQVAIQ